MTNYNERLDEVLANLVNQVAANEQRLLNGNATRKATIDSDSHATTEAKQALTSLIKELVADAKPEEYAVCENTKSVSSWCNQCWACRTRHNSDLWDGIEVGIEKFEQNLLKVLGYEDEK